MNMAQIIGYMTASQKIIFLELQSAHLVHGEKGIPPEVIKRILENMEKEIASSNEAWENRSRAL